MTFYKSNDMSLFFGICSYEFSLDEVRNHTAKKKYLIRVISKII